MTVGIAAMCEINTTSPKIVFSADRLITSNTTFEHGFSKSRFVTDNCFILQSSNDSLKADELIENTRVQILNKYKENYPPLLELTQQLSLECEKAFKKEIEKTVLEKYSLTFSDFLKKQKDFSEQFMKNINLEIASFSYSFCADFLVVGLEPETNRAHIYRVNERGSSRLCDFLAFSTIGNGGNLAFSEFTKSSFSGFSSLSETLVRVFNAKKASERAGGVGTVTDLVVLYIEGKKCKFWIPTEAALTILQKGYEEKDKTERAIYSKVMSQLSEMFNQNQEK